MTLSVADTHFLTVAALIGCVFAFGKALNALVDAVAASFEVANAHVAHRTYTLDDGNRAVETLFFKNGTGVERTRDFIGSFSTVRERPFIWRPGDRGVPCEWVRIE